MQYNCPQISRVCLIFPGYLAKMTKFQDFSRLEKLSPFSQVFQELWEPCRHYYGMKNLLSDDKHRFDRDNSKKAHWKSETNSVRDKIQSKKISDNFFPIIFFF